jgi:hypothetical protein
MDPRLRGDDESTSVTLAEPRADPKHAFPAYAAADEALPSPSRGRERPSETLDSRLRGG